MYPDIHWREPVELVVPGKGRGLGCRLCIGHWGIAASDIPSRTMKTTEDYESHMAVFHPV